MEQLKAAGGKAPSMNLVEETMAADAERMAHHKKKWRSRWRVCSCCCCCLWLGGFLALFLLYATSPWQQLCDDCGWNKRAHFGAVLRSTDGRIFIIGGRNGEQNFGDVWSGNREGTEWQRLVEIAFGPRHGHAVLCSRSGELLVLGGDEGGIGDQPSPRNDVWRSSDGKTWVQQLETSPWASRKFFGAVMDNEDRIYITGGLGGHGTGGFNDLWISEDLARSWRAAVFAAPWSGRYSFGLVRVPGGLQEGSICLLAGYDGFAHHDVWLGDAEGANGNEMSSRKPLQIGSWCASHITEKAATTSLSTEHLGHLDTLFRQLLMPVAASESMAASWRRRGWKVFSAEMRGNFHLQRLRQMTGGKSEVGMRGSMCAPSLQSGFNQVRRHGLHEPDMWRWWIQKVTLSSSSAERDLQASWQTCGRRLSALTWSICTTCWS